MTENWRQDYYDNPPRKATFDQLINSEYGSFKNYADNGFKWQVLLGTGWFYTGAIGDEIGYLCKPESRLDPVTF